MIEFGCGVHLDPLDFDTVRALALRSEELGFNSIWFNDHFVPIPPSSHEQYLECWTTISAIAALTQKVRLGTVVLCNSYRHPPILAKMSSTLDVISKGRLILGLGAGWYEEDCRRYGIPFPNFQERAERLEEALQIIKLMWTEDSPNFRGKYYHIQDAVNSPKPVQKPHPPLMVGGTSIKILKVAARYADIHNMMATPEECIEKWRILDKLSIKSGRDPRSIKRTVWFRYSLIGRTPVEFEKKMKGWYPRRLTPEYYVPRGLFGTPEQCIKRLQQYVESGVESFMIRFHDNFDSMEIFVKEIMPKFL